RRGERIRMDHAGRLLVLGPDRSCGRRRPRQSGRPDLRGGELLVPPASNRPGPELRAAHAVRDFRVREYLFALVARGFSRANLMNHLLSIILFLPLAGALVLLLIKRENVDAIRWTANIVAFLGFVVSLPLWYLYDPQSSDLFQQVERAQWIPSIGAEYYLGVDGLSVLLILLTTMMGCIAVLSSWTAITERVKEYYIFLLVLQTGMLGAFMALDFLLFFLFWEVMLVPMYFLIGIWCTARRLSSAIKFFLYTLVGSVVMLLGILAVYFQTPPTATSAHSFDVTQMYTLNLPYGLQWWVFLAFFLGFAIKVPMFPFHTWLPD